uniref:NADH dehydrogenase subunit 2 n=1 Tax=Chaetocnema confinis TaxID=1896592 RepID=UPI002239019D|nr:NADH dehydrogenase subunit 2 [Chaetocnema confinis]UYC28907.1 NADH dehydrogenase subunit 2 [Chaetocnema confinis]
MLFFMMMLLGTLLSISSYNWFSLWIGLEVNLLSIIPLFKNEANKLPTEAMIKYFITQAIASTFIIFSMITLMSVTELPFLSESLILMMNSALFTKLGAAPFHFWFPEVSEGLSWWSNFMLMTWQKIAPSVILMYNINTFMFTIVILMSTITGGILGVNQTSLRKLLTYSSISHISWMLASMLFFKMIWWNYFIIYTFMTLSIIFMMEFFKIYHLSQITFMVSNEKLIKLIFMLNFFSMGGLPPFIGFYPKWLTLNLLIFNQFYFLSLIMVICTMMTLYFYLRITFSTLMLNYDESIKNFKTKNKNIVFNSFLLLSLPISMNLFNFM